MLSKKLLFLVVFCFSFILLAQPASSVKHPDWSYNKTIYEVNIRQFTKEGTFNSFAEQLPRLKEMGVGIIWLMPINPIGEVNRKGSLGSYYSIKDYLKVNPEFGTFSDFKELVNKAHKLGLYVIIDWVANHTSWDNQMIKDHPEWYTKDSSGKFVAPVADWADVVDLNYDNKDLWKYMTDALLYWVKEANIDGYRCDVAGMVPTEFWNQARIKLDKVKPVFMLAEWETPEMHSKAFDMTYSWDLYKLGNDVSTGKKNVSDIRKYFVETESKYHQKAFRMRFITNHDENTWNGTEFERMGKEQAELFTIFNYTITGMPLTYNGQESNLSKRLEFFERDPIDWKNYEAAAFFKKLNNLRGKNKALFAGERGGKLVELKTNNPDDVFAFKRSVKKDEVVAVFNMSEKEVETTLNGIKGTFKNFFSNEKVSVSKEYKVTLKPWKYILLVK